NNRVSSGAPSGVVAPIFGVDSANPNSPKQGNPANYAIAPIPTGTQTYGGSPLVGTGFTASLWAANSTLADDQMVQIATAPFRVTTSASFFGFWQPPSGAQPVVPGVVGNSADRAKFVVRVWDNKGGTVLNWAQVLAAPDRIAHGESTVFVVNAPLGAGTGTPPNLAGRES